MDWFYDDDLPSSLCKFFWMFIWSVLSIPFLGIPFLIQKYWRFSDCDIPPVGITVVFTLSFVVASVVFFIPGQNEANTSYLLYILKAEAITIIVLATVIFIFWIAEIIYDKTYEKRGIIRSYIKAKKNGVCPIIRYVDNTPRSYYSSKELDTNKPQSDFMYWIDTEDMTIIIRDLKLKGISVNSDINNVLTYISKNEYDLALGIKNFKIFGGTNKKTRYIIDEYDILNNKVKSTSIYE